MPISVGAAHVMRAAQAIAPLLDSVMFVGGSIVELLLEEDTGATIYRTTEDFDLVINVVARHTFHAFERDLRNLGFSPDIFAKHIGRWRNQEIVVDVAATDANIMGFTNRWYKIAWSHATFVRVVDLALRVPPTPAWLACKLDAFWDRGKGDVIDSHDFEDIVRVIDGCPSLKATTNQLPLELQDYLGESMHRILADPQAPRGISYCLGSSRQHQARTQIITNRMVALVR